MTKRTPLKLGFFNERPNLKGALMVSYICKNCLECQTIHKSKMKINKFQICPPCYFKSEVKKENAKKGVLKRRNYDSKNNPNFKNRPQIRTCPCGQEFTRPILESDPPNKHKYCSVKCRAQYSVSIAKHMEYNGIRMRSSWEVIIARELDRRGLVWFYEPSAFETPFGFYTPDFYIPSWGAYLEVKGVFRDENSKDKYEWFSSQYWTHLVNQEGLEGFGYNLSHGNFIRNGQYIKRPHRHKCPTLSDLLRAVI